MFSTTKDARTLKQAAIPHPSHRSMGSSRSFSRSSTLLPYVAEREDNSIEIFAPHRSKTADRKRRSESDELLRTLAARLAEHGPDADRLRHAISESMGKDCFDSQGRAD